MAVKGISLDALLSSWGDGDINQFEPIARYHESMDCVIYLQADVAYRADRVDGFLTLLWHPDNDVLVGVKIKGFRWIFKRWQALCVDGNSSFINDDDFLPMMKVIELALTATLAAILSKASEAEEPPPLEEMAAQQREAERHYEQARQIVGSMSVKVSQLRAAA